MYSFCLVQIHFKHSPSEDTMTIINMKAWLMDRSCQNWESLVDGLELSKIRCPSDLHGPAQSCHLLIVQSCCVFDGGQDIVGINKILGQDERSDKDCFLFVNFQAMPKLQTQPYLFMMNPLWIQADKWYSPVVFDQYLIVSMLVMDQGRCHACTNAQEHQKMEFWWQYS